jgi:hypothetical protein
MSGAVDNTDDRDQYRAYEMAADRMGTVVPGIPTAPQTQQHSIHIGVALMPHDCRDVLTAGVPDSASYTDVISDHHAALAVPSWVAGLSATQHSQRMHAD